LGLCGILAHHLGAHRVVLTDGDTDTLALLRDNVAVNVSSSGNKAAVVECRQLRWGQEEFVHGSATQETFSLILASDVIYVEEIIEPLLDTVVALLAQDGGGGMFWLSYARRNVSIDKVLASAKRHGLSWKEPSEAAVEGVYVFQRIS
jgi:predicted nicotinamide N-methyase